MKAGAGGFASTSGSPLAVSPGGGAEGRSRVPSRVRPELGLQHPSMPAVAAVPRRVEEKREKEIKTKRKKMNLALAKW